MSPLPDIRLHLPIELLDEFSEVIRAGLQRAKISPEARKNLAYWWEAEKECFPESPSE